MIRRLLTAIAVAGALALGGCISTGPVPIPPSVAGDFFKAHPAVVAKAHAACGWRASLSQLRQMAEFLGYIKGEVAADAALLDRAALAICASVPA